MMFYWFQATAVTLGCPWDESRLKMLLVPDLLLTYNIGVHDYKNAEVTLKVAYHQIIFFFWNDNQLSFPSRPLRTFSDRLAKRPRSQRTQRMWLICP